MALDPTQNKKIHLLPITILCTTLQIIIIHTTLSHSADANQNCSAYCGNISLQHPFCSFPYKQMLQCNHEAQKLQLRTVSGLFEIQALDYNTHTMIIWDPSMSTCSSLNPINDQHFSVDSLLPPTTHNTILLFNCPLSLGSSGVCKNNSEIDYCKDEYENCAAFEGLRGGSSAAAAAALGCCVTDFGRLGKRRLGELQCKHYASVYGGGKGSKWGYGIMLSFSLPDRIPDIRLCDECDKPNGDCGIGLRCICHPQQCENQVLSKAIVPSLSCRTILEGLLFSFLFTGLGIWNLL